MADERIFRMTRVFAADIGRAVTNLRQKLAGEGLQMKAVIIKPAPVQPDPELVWWEIICECSK